MGKPITRGEAWQGDWRIRLSSELERRACPSLRAFAKMRGCITYREIAEALDGPFAPVQMEMAIGSEFEREGDLPGRVVDTVARYLVQCVRRTTLSRTQREFQVAAAFAKCVAAIGPANEAGLTQVWEALKTHLMDGWLPSSADDSVVVEAVANSTWRAAGGERPN
jgi:hypothetical protein